MPTRGRCHDYTFLRFLPIFGEKWRFFSKTNIILNILQKLAAVLAKKQHHVSPNFPVKIFEKSEPRSPIKHSLQIIKESDLKANKQTCSQRDAAWEG
jgi:hypothetical protein